MRKKDRFFSAIGLKSIPAIAGSSSREKIYHCLRYTVSCIEL